jgi:hypothetical protein
MLDSQSMKIVFGILLAVGLIFGGGLCIPLANHVMEKSCEDMNKFWRWRLLGLLSILVGITVIGTGFYVLARTFG